MLKTKPFFKQILIALPFIITTPFNHAETAGIVHDQSAHHASENNDWPGVYQGFTPCEDCIGVKTSLGLNANHSYVLMTQFVGKSTREFVEKGKYTFDNANKIINLTQKNGSMSNQYKVETDALIQLDKQGNPYAGKDAERYILRRTDVAGAPKEHSGH